jgi:hypothetical protein
MAELYPVAGAKIFIGGVLSTKKTAFSASDFSGQTWVEIDGWETCGGFGDGAELITTQLINRQRDLKMKGTRNSGSMENNFAIIRADAGQVALRAAEATDTNYAFKIEWDDAPAGDAPTPTIQYFIGLVMSANDQGGSANTVQMLSSTIEINSNIVTVASATGDE